LVGLAVGSAFAVSSIVAVLVVRLGRATDFVDRPDSDLKPHTGTPVPLGGIAVFLGAHTGLALVDEFDLALFVATSLVLIMGVVDDRRGLSPLVRLSGAAVAGAILALGSDLWGAVATVLLVVVVVNAINLFDGLDALASSVSAVSFAGLAALSWVTGVPVPWLPVIAAGALVGVLLLNWPPARLYLGDNGAYVIGVLLSWVVLRIGSDWQVGLVGAALIGVPLFDLVLTVARRIRSGAPLFEGDRDHTYDRLRRTRPILVVVGLMVAAQAVWGGALTGVTWWLGATPALVLAVAAFGITSAAPWIAPWPHRSTDADQMPSTDR
jgi:UDP-GlcNAc:undecaprenyl-phosphate GlcNAc-1-phosphate transferase